MLCIQQEMLQVRDGTSPANSVACEKQLRRNGPQSLTWQGHGQEGTRGGSHGGTQGRGGHCIGNRAIQVRGVAQRRAPTIQVSI